MIVRLLDRISSYTLPISKEHVRGGQDVTVTNHEGQKCLASGLFLHISDEDGDPGDTLTHDWKNARILVRCGAGIGDALMATVLVNVLRSVDCSVHFAVSASAVPFVSLLVGIEAVHSHGDVVEREYDIVLDMSDAMRQTERTALCTNYHQAILNKANIRRHETVFPKFSFNARFTPACKSANTKILAIHPEASADNRRWPIENWRTLVRTVVSHGVCVVVLGQDAMGLGELGAIDCTKRNAQDQVFQLMQASAFIGVDSCFMHLAGMMNKPSVVMFGPTSPETVTGSYKKLRAVQPRSGCYAQGCLGNAFCSHDAECIKGIPTADVLCAVAECLGLRMARDIPSPPIAEAAPPLPTAKPGSPEPLQEYLKRRERVGFVLPYAVLGGGEIMTLRLAEALRKFFDVVVYSTFDWRENAECAERFRGLPSVTLGRMADLRDKCVDDDVLVWYGAIDSPVASVVAAGKPSIRVVHSEFSEEVEKFESTYGGAADATVCVSEALLDRIQNAVFIPNMFDVVNVSRKDRVPLADDDRKTIAFVGRLDHNKRVAWLVENLAELNCRLLVKGQDSPQLTRRDIIAVAEGAGVLDRVTILDDNTSVAAVYNTADALIVPSEREACPLVVLEAGAVGCPVIATPVGTLKKTFGDAIKFIRVDKGGMPDVESLRMHIEDVTPTDGDALRRQVLAKCSPDVVAAQYRRILRGVVGRVSYENSVGSGLSLIRHGGAGDVVMATALLSRVRETLPSTPLELVTAPQYADVVQKAFHGGVSVVQSVSEGYTAFDVSYNDSWLRGIHAVVGMGGVPGEIRVGFDELPARRKRSKPRVAFVRQMAGVAEKKIKEWPEERWVELFKRLRRAGYTVSDLGLPTTSVINGAADQRVDSFERFVALVDDADYVVAIEGVTCHVGAAVKKPCLIIVGGSSKAFHTSYPIHTHVTSRDGCECWGSVDKSDIPDDCAIECMSSITVDDVMEAFERYVLQ